MQLIMLPIPVCWEYVFFGCVSFMFFSDNSLFHVFLSGELFVRGSEFNAELRCEQGEPGQPRATKAEAQSDVGGDRTRQQTIGFGRHGGGNFCEFREWKI